MPEDGWILRGLGFTMRVRAKMPNMHRSARIYMFSIAAEPPPPASLAEIYEVIEVNIYDEMAFSGHGAVEDGKSYHGRLMGRIQVLPITSRAQYRSIFKYKAAVTKFQNVGP